MKPKIISVLLFLSLAGGLYYSMFYSHWFASFFVPKIIEWKFPEMKVRLFEFKDRSFKPFHGLTFEFVDLILQQKDRLFEVRADSLDIDRLFSDRKAQHYFHVHLKNAIVAADPLVFEKVQLDLDIDADKEILNGEVSAARLSAGDYELTDILSPVGGTFSEIKFESLNARMYGGELSGDITIRKTPVLSYILNFHFDGVDVQKMRVVNSKVFSQVGGRLNGHFTFAGEGSELKDFSGDLDISENAQIKASLVGMLANYIPQSTQKQDLEKLMAVDGNIGIEKANFKIKSLNSKKISTEIDLESKKLNMDLNVGVDINLDASITDLIGQIKDFLANRDR